MAKYANGIAMKKGLGLRFQAILPMQMVAGTGVGDTGAEAHAADAGFTPAEFLTRFGAPLPPRAFGADVIEIMENEMFATALAL